MCFAASLAALCLYVLLPCVLLHIVSCYHLGLPVLHASLSVVLILCHGTLRA